MNPFIASTLILPLLTLLFGFWLGKVRDGEKTIFSKKLEIYSDIVYHLNSAKYLRPNLGASLQKLESLIKCVDCQNENKSITANPDPLGKMWDATAESLRQSEYVDELVKLFAPARLIGSTAVVNELRNYYSLIFEFQTIEKEKSTDDVSKKISKSVMELEQLMRKDLGRRRILSEIDIRKHTC